MKPLLLHACCAPCSLEPVRLLREEGLSHNLLDQPQYSAAR